MTFDEFFDQLPSAKLVGLSNNEIREVYDLAKNSVIIFKSDDTTLSEWDKVKLYKSYCRDLVAKSSYPLNSNDKMELDKFVTLFSTYFMLEHLANE